MSLERHRWPPRTPRALRRALLQVPRPVPPAPRALLGLRWALLPWRQRTPRRCSRSPSACRTRILGGADPCSAIAICTAEGSAIASEVRGAVLPDADIFFANVIRGAANDISAAALTVGVFAKAMGPSAKDICEYSIARNVRGAAPPGAVLTFANEIWVYAVPWEPSAIAIWGFPSPGEPPATAALPSASTSSSPPIACWASGTTSSSDSIASSVLPIACWASVSRIFWSAISFAIAIWQAAMADDVPGAPVDGRVAGEGGARKYRDSTPRASSWKAMSIGRASGSTMHGRIVPSHLDRDRRVRAPVSLPPKSGEVMITRPAQVLFRSFFRWVATLSPSRLQKGSMGIRGSPASSGPSTASSSPSRNGIRTRAA